MSYHVFEQDYLLVSIIHFHIRDTIFSGPGTQIGMHYVCTVASSLGTFHAWDCVSNRMEWAIEFF